MPWKRSVSKQRATGRCNRQEHRDGESRLHSICVDYTPTTPNRRPPSCNTTRLPSRRNVLEAAIRPRTRSIPITFDRIRSFSSVLSWTVFYPPDHSRNSNRFNLSEEGRKKIWSQIGHGDKGSKKKTRFSSAWVKYQNSGRELGDRIMWIFALSSSSLCQFCQSCSIQEGRVLGYINFLSKWWTALFWGHKLKFILWYCRLWCYIIKCG